MPSIEELSQQVAKLQQTVEVLSRTGISSGQMKVQSISVQVSDRTRCNAGCKFCISRTTPADRKDTVSESILDFNRLEVGLEFAKRGGAYTAILTGKADPLQESPTYIGELIRTCKQYLPTVDMHTNGFVFHEKPNFLSNFQNHGLTMITFSIAHHKSARNSQLMRLRSDYDPWEQVRLAQKLGLMVRCSVVLCKAGVNDLASLLDYIETAKIAGAHQVVVRELWLPDRIESSDHDVFDWNRHNKVLLETLYNEVLQKAEQSNSLIKFVRYLPWGTAVFEINGMNVTFARCEESYNGGTLKSLVHRIDGHGYMDWDHTGSILY